MNEPTPPQDVLVENNQPSVPREIVPNPENVKAIHRWVGLQSSWGSGHPIENHTEYAPALSREDLQAAVLTMRSLGIPQQEYDIRGYYITALADKVLRDEFRNAFPNGASEEQERSYWEKAQIDLYRPQTGKYDGFRNFGTDWTRGTLVLHGNFRDDKKIGYGMNGGRIIVNGDAGEDLGTFMSGGVIEVEGHTHGRKGYGKTGGEIIVHGNDVTYTPPEIPKEPPKTVMEQFESAALGAFAEHGVGFEEAKDVEKDVRQLVALIGEGVIPIGVPFEKPRGWFAQRMEAKNTWSLSYFDGTERSYRAPSARVKIHSASKGVYVEARDWRKAEKVENHPFSSNRGTARKGKYYSGGMKEGYVYHPRAGAIIDDGEEFPRVENLATQAGFGQLQMYELRHLVHEASEALKAKAEF